MIFRKIKLFKPEWAVGSSFFIKQPSKQSLRVIDREKEVYMRCPHCSTNISIFSPAIMGPTKPGGARKCKHCENFFAITADKKVAAVAAIGTALIGFFVLRPIPVAGPALWGLVTVLVTFLVGARLKKV